jgi:hypothetical protein
MYVNCTAQEDDVSTASRTGAAACSGALLRSSPWDASGDKSFTSLSLLCTAQVLQTHVHRLLWFSRAQHLLASSHAGLRSTAICLRARKPCVQSTRGTAGGGAVALHLSPHGPVLSLAPLGIALAACAAAHLAREQMNATLAANNCAVMRGSTARRTKETEDVLGKE